MTMISASLKNQNNGIDNRLNESDKLLSDKYILAKDIRDLNRTLLDSTVKMNVHEDELKKMLKLKERFERYIQAFDEIQKESSFIATKNEVSTDLSSKRDTQIEDNNKPIEKKYSKRQKINNAVKSVTDKKGGVQYKINKLIERLNTESDLQELKECIKNEKSDFVRIKQLLIDNNHHHTIEIRILREKIENRNNANSDVKFERDNLKEQMRNIIEEIAGHEIFEVKE